MSKPTNMFVFLRPKSGLEHDLSGQFIRHTNLKLASSCRITLFNIQNDAGNSRGNRFDQLDIFNDANDIHVSSINNIQSTQQKSENKTQYLNHLNTENVFYECNIILKGFKDKMVKGKSIWIQ